MGLSIDTTERSWHINFGGFEHLRNEWGRLAGIPDWLDRTAPAKPNDPLWIILDRPDTSDAEPIAYNDAGKLAARLRQLAERMEAHDAAKTRELAEVLSTAPPQRQPAVFS